MGIEFIENPIVAQPAYEVCMFNETPSFVAMFRTSYHCTPCSVSLIESTNLDANSFNICLPCVQKVFQIISSFHILHLKYFIHFSSHLYVPCYINPILFDLNHIGYSKNYQAAPRVMLPSLL
jgi:hypothetical protein